jgi:hypothetical protein
MDILALHSTDTDHQRMLLTGALAGELALLTTIDDQPVTLATADASWLACLWQLSPGAQRSVTPTALTLALEAHARAQATRP